jgi:ADP-ribose pyrophosphatase YjhB (NUDIX family)
MATVDRSYVRVKSMVALLDGARGNVAVIRFQDSTKTPPYFHRLVGGSIDCGEKASAAATREVEEELGIVLPQVQLLGVVENIFEFRGERGHEIVFIFSADVAHRDVPAAGAWYTDEGRPMWVEWRSLIAPPALPLYPDGAAELIAAAAPSRGPVT